MAKKKTKKTRKEQELAKAYEARHRKNLKLYQKEIADAYREAAQEAASISSLIESAELEEAFTFASHPITHQRAARMMDKLRNSLSVAIANGVRSEWTLANNKNNELCNVVFANAAGLLGVSQYSRYYSTNQRALDAFLERKQQGLNLSERVWRYAEQFKKEIEMGIDIGLRDGLPASEMATSLKQYLQHPDKLFRRVRDEHGELHLSKAAKAFHPGQGIYRSSYKNAQRLAITEGNIAFRTADHLRMQEMDFIVGQHVILSNNHTCLGVKGVFYDICDELSGVNEDDPRGRYPKDFKFTGWHPHCRCGVTAILKTDEEIAEDTQKILNGEPLDGESVNRVNDVPEKFKGWLKDNEERISRAKSLPYFMADNEKYCQEMKITARAREGADQIQRTDKAIKNAMDASRQDFSDIEDTLRKASEPRAVKTFVSFEPFSPAIMEQVSRIQDRNAKNRLFESILNDERANVMNITKKARTTMFPNNRGLESPSWRKTLKMAEHMNNSGRSVCFLPEYKGKTSADAIVEFQGRWTIADFKVSSRNNYNTIAEDVITGFKQAGTVVLQINDGDAGTFREMVKQFGRKNCFGNVILMNEYGKIRELSTSDIRTGKYKKIIKGFL